MTEAKGPDKAPQEAWGPSPTATPVRRQGSGAMLFIALLGIGLLVLAAFLGYGEVGYALNGAEVQGMVTDLTDQPPPAGAKGGTEEYDVAYTFRPGVTAQAISGDDDVDESEWDTFRVGGAITIQFQRSDPGDFNRPAGNSDLLVIPIISIFGILFAGVGLWGTWTARRRT